MPLANETVLLAPAHGASQHVVLPLKLSTFFATYSAADTAQTLLTAPDRVAAAPILGHWLLQACDMMSPVAVVTSDHIPLHVYRRLLAQLTIITVQTDEAILGNTAIFQTATIVVVRLGTLQTVHHARLLCLARPNRAARGTNVRLGKEIIVCGVHHGFEVVGHFHIGGRDDAIFAVSTTSSAANARLIN